MASLSTTPSRLQYLSQQNNTNATVDPFTGMSKGYSYPLGVEAYQAPKDAHPDFAMAYADYLGTTIGGGTADPLPWEDWYRMETQPQNAAPAPAPAPAQTQQSAPAAQWHAPPPPPPPPRPTMVSWSDVAPSLIDLGQLRSQFSPDQAVMDSFNNMLTGIDSDVQAGRTEVDRQRDFGVGQVDTLPGEYERIFGGVQNMLSGATGASEAAMAAAGQSGAPDFHAQPLGAATELVRGGFEATVPLLKAGFGEQATKQHGFLTQLGSEMKRDVEGRKTGYLADIDTSADAAAAQAMGQNTQFSNTFSQFNASNRADVDRYNAAAQDAYNQGNWQAAQDYAKLAANAANKPMELALQGVGPGMTLQQIADMNKPKGAEDEDFSIDDLARKYAPGTAEMSTERGKKLSLEGFEPFGGGPETYEKVVQELLKTPVAEWEGLIAENDAWHKHPRAVSLAMLAAGGPISSERLAGLS